VLVAEVDDEPVALAHVQLPARREAWLEGIRVHPGHRRRGIADALNRACCDWARERGALVARLAIEVENVPPLRQVEALGWRPLAEWVYLVDRRGLERADPQLGPAPRPATADDLPAMVAAWDRSALRAPAGDLLAIGWLWRRMVAEDVAAGVMAGQAVVGADGFALFQPADEGVRIAWLEAAPAHVGPLVEAVRRRARDEGRAPPSAMLPADPALLVTCARLGLEPEAWLRVFGLEL